MQARRCAPGRHRRAWYGTPALKVGGKGFVRLKEDSATAVFVVDSVETQEALIEAIPAIYFLTEHDKGHPAVLARLAKLPRAEALDRLEQAWRQKASAGLRKARDPSGERSAEPAGKPPRPRKSAGESRHVGPGRRGAR